MGACLAGGLSPEEQAAMQHEQKASKALDKSLQNQIQTENKVHKLLLLGTGESGKSTVFKQMQILYDQQKGFSPIEQSTFKHVVRTNVVECIQALIQGCERFEFAWEHPKTPAAVAAMKELDAHSSDFWVPSIVPNVIHLWNEEPAIQKMFENRSKIQLLDSTEYLCKHVQRIGEDNYLPTKDDILRARLRTSGIHEKVFNIHGVDFKFLDVGGQRNERRKWIHCFDQVTSVIFVAAISEYDQELYECEGMNRLHESLYQFAELSNLEHFKETSFILFLNKIDLFEDKVPRVDIRCCFPNFQGNASSVDECLHYITMQFFAARENENFSPGCEFKDKETPQPATGIYPHTTCATDTDNIEKVFEACKLIILQSNLEKLGIS